MQEMETLGGLEYAHEPQAREQRGEDRIVLSEQPQGRLTVLTSHSRVDAIRVRDISRSGISLELDRLIHPDTPVSVEYVQDALDLSVNGRLAWSRSNSGSGDETAAAAYVVGIELFSPGLLLNFLPTRNSA